MNAERKAGAGSPAADDALATSWDELADRLVETVQRLESRVSLALFRPEDDSRSVSLVADDEGVTRAFVMGQLAPQELARRLSQGFAPADEEPSSPLVANLPWPASTAQTRAFVEVVLDVLRDSGAQSPADLVYQTLRYGLEEPDERGIMRRVEDPVANHPVQPFGLVRSPLRRNR